MPISAPSTQIQSARGAFYVNVMAAPAVSGRLRARSQPPGTSPVGAVALTALMSTPLCAFIWLDQLISWAIVPGE